MKPGDNKNDEGVMPCPDTAQSSWVIWLSTMGENLNRIKASRDFAATESQTCPFRAHGAKKYTPGSLLWIPAA